MCLLKGLVVIVTMIGALRVRQYVMLGLFGIRSILVKQELDGLIIYD